MKDGSGPALHILFLIQSMRGGGAERVTANLANFWAERGDCVTIVTLSGLDGDAYKLVPGVRRIALDQSADSTTVLDAVIGNLRRVRAVRGALASERPDVAVGMMTTASCLLGLAGRRRGVITVGTERTHPPSDPLGRAWTAIRRFSYGRLDAVVAQTRETASWLERETRARQVSVIPNPVVFPLPSGEPVLTPAEHLDPDAKTLLAIGRLMSYKGYDRLLDAFAQIAPEMPGWQLAIVGDGPMRDELAALADRLAIGDRVRFVGRVGNVGDWYAAADIFVMTSHFEGFPNVLCESMACGLPVVSVDCSAGPREIIRDGVDGLLVRNHDNAALAGALRRLMLDEGLRKRLGAAALGIRDRLAISRVAAEWEALFTRLRERRHPGGRGRARSAGPETSRCRDRDP